MQIPLNLHELTEHIKCPLKMKSMSILQVWIPFGHDMFLLDFLKKSYNDKNDLCPFSLKYAIKRTLCLLIGKIGQ